MISPSPDLSIDFPSSFPLSSAPHFDLPSPAMKLVPRLEAEPGGASELGIVTSLGTADAWLMVDS